MSSAHYISNYGVTNGHTSDTFKSDWIIKFRSELSFPRTTRNSFSDLLSALLSARILVKSNLINSYTFGVIRDFSQLKTFDYFSRDIMWDLILNYAYTQRKVFIMYYIHFTYCRYDQIALTFVHGRYSKLL